MIELARNTYFLPGAQMNGSALAACAFGLLGCLLLLAVFAGHLHMNPIWTTLEFGVLSLSLTILVWWIPAFCLLLAGYFCRPRRTALS